MATKGFNRKYGFSLSYWFLKDGKDVTFDADTKGAIYEEHVYFFSRYLAKQYAEKRLLLKESEYFIKKQDSERWVIFFVKEMTHDDVLNPDYDEAISN